MALEIPQEQAADPGTVLKLLIEASGGDYRGAALAIGRSTQALSDRISGRAQIKAEEIRRLANYFGVKPGIFFVAPMEFFRQIGNMYDASSDESPGQDPVLRLVGSRGTPQLW